jgi:hypothetical protein
MAAGAIDIDVNTLSKCPRISSNDCNGPDYPEPLKIPRNLWVMLAIAEKLDRDGG